MRHKAHGEGSQQHAEQAALTQPRPVAAVFAVAGAILHKDVVAARAHQTETFVTLNARLAHVCAAAEVAPFAVHFLPDLAAHGRPHTLQMLQLGGLLAIRDGQCTVVERITALGIVVGATIPAFYAISCSMEITRENVCLFVFMSTEPCIHCLPVCSTQQSTMAAITHFSTVFIANWNFD